MNTLHDDIVSDDTALSVRGLSKTFSKLKAVEDLTFEMPRGGVIGFVGPNGAGKSTTIRILLGLIKPTKGEARVLGYNIQNPSSYLPKVGALIEAPAFYPGLSAADNLKAFAKLGGFSLDGVPKVLEMVGLTSRAKDKVANYSLGMKQRMGIALALLPDPELLILDEPTNGLDPAGIVEIRKLLKELGRSGRTVFVSTHLLSEVEAEADRLVMIHNGNLVFAGELTEIMQKACDTVFAIPENIDDLSVLVGIAEDGGFPFHREEDSISIEAPREWSSELNRLAASKGINLRELRPQCESLEDIFLNMTRGKVAK
ncbi:ABC transporter ATP-binding protein [Chloroflexota bacterium]